MLQVYFGKKEEGAFDLELSNDLIAVRTRSGQSINASRGPVATPQRSHLTDANLVVAYPEAGVEVYRVPTAKGLPTLDDRKKALRTSPDVRFAGGVLVDPATKQPVLYTENLFIKFDDSVDPDHCLQVISDAGMTVKEEVDYATNAYFVCVPEGTGRKVFNLAISLLDCKEVEYCHPELIRPRARKRIFPQQWHLAKTQVEGVTVDAHANVAEAHKVTLGDGVTIAVIDDGVDIDHDEFAGPNKIVAPRDVTLQSNDPRPKYVNDNHGTACAGVACANGTHGASGVAPAARLMPIRLSLGSGLGSQREAHAFKWAADNGADVISCSWGPQDGPWWDPGSPGHNQPYALPANIRLAMDYAVSNGRGGKGCVILFAAGNGNESVDNDGYASYEKVIAVAACNDTSRRSVYSDKGDALWCAFPSNDFGYSQFNHPNPLSPGIWTTDRSATSGYNNGNAQNGDAAGDYANNFGGTSSSTPGAAGVVALVLSIDPQLKWHEVKEVLKQCCDRIDPQGGNYGSNGHSKLYGYGRLNARRAVELAEPKARTITTINRRFDALLPDVQTTSFNLVVGEDTPVDEVEVDIELLHTYVGDLAITLTPPSTTGVDEIMLRHRIGGSGRDLSLILDSESTPELAGFRGKSCKGTWVLHIQDAAPRDTGTLTSFTIKMTTGQESRSTPRTSGKTTPVPVKSSTKKSRRKKNSKSRR